MQSIAIFEALLTQAAPVVVLVATRIYPVELPQGCLLPAIAIEAQDDVALPTIDAYAGFGLRKVDVQLHLVAKTVADLAALQTAVEAACTFQRGVIATYNVASIAAATVGGAETDSQLGLWYMPITFTLTYRR